MLGYVSHDTHTMCEGFNRHEKVKVVLQRVSFELIIFICLLINCLLINWKRKYMKSKRQKKTSSLDHNFFHKTTKLLSLGGLHNKSNLLTFNLSTAQFFNISSFLVQPLST